MSEEITRKIVARQLAAMRASRFEIGVLQQTGRMLLREGWSAGQVDYGKVEGGAIPLTGTPGRCAAGEFVRANNAATESL